MRTRAHLTQSQKGGRSLGTASDRRGGDRAAGVTGQASLRKPQEAPGNPGKTTKNGLFGETSEKARGAALPEFPATE
eukprot:1179869-Prorocentrum_minimum.AAC.8